MTSKEQAQLTGTLQKLLTLCLKYPTAENIALAKEVMKTINVVGLQSADKVAE